MLTIRRSTLETRAGNAAENMAIARKLALQLLNRVPDKKSMKNRRKMAGWDEHYLLNILHILTEN